MTKVCTKCGIEKDVSEFNKCKRGLYGVKGRCRVCTSADTREWKSRNKEKISEYNKVYSKAHSEEISARQSRNHFANKEENNKKSREYYHANKEERIAYARQYVDENREEINRKARLRHENNKDAENAKHREWYWRNVDEQREKSIAYQVEHKEEMREYGKRYRKEHPEIGRACRHRRTARLNGNGGDHTGKDELWQYDVQGGKCFWCGNELNGVYQIDHIIPITKGGGNGRDNIDCACGDCNRSKKDKLPWDWIGDAAYELIEWHKQCLEIDLQDKSKRPNFISESE